MKKFFVLWSSQAASLFGSAVVQFALAWYLTRETGSATVLATALMLSFIPQIILGPLVGPFIDRWNRKMILIFADLYVMLLTVVLIILFATDSAQIWHIYLIMIGRTIGETFQMPALGASIPMIVPEEHLVRANGLFQMLQSGVKVVAPPAGAILLDTMPMQSVLSVDIITAIIAVACLLPLVIPRPERTTLTEKANHLDDIKQGFHYVWARHGLVILIGMMALLFFFVAPAAGLIPVLVNTHLEGDVLKLGWLTSATGIGGVAGGLLLGVWGGLSRRIHTVILGLMIMIPCSVGLGLTSPSIYYATTIPSMFFMGVGISFFSAPSNAIMQTVVAKDMQGRVFALYHSLVAAAFPLGLIIGGPVADAFGIRSLYFIASGAWLIILSLAMFSKSLMNLEYQKVEDNFTAESGVKSD